MSAMPGSPSRRRCEHLAPHALAKRCRRRRLGQHPLGVRFQDAEQLRIVTARGRLQRFVVEAQRHAVAFEPDRAAEDLLVLVDGALGRVREPDLARRPIEPSSDAAGRQREPELAHRDGMDVGANVACSSNVVSPSASRTPTHPPDVARGEADVAGDLAQRRAQVRAGAGHVLEQRSLRHRRADVQPQRAAAELLARHAPHRHQLLDHQRVGAVGERRLRDAGGGADGVHVQPDGPHRGQHPAQDGRRGSGFARVGAARRMPCPMLDRRADGGQRRFGVILSSDWRARVRGFGPGADYQGA